MTSEHLPGLLAYVLVPLAIALGMGLVAVVRRRSSWSEYVSRKRGHWHVYTPQQDGTRKALGKWWLLRQYKERDRHAKN